MTQRNVTHDSVSLTLQNVMFMFLNRDINQNFKVCSVFCHDLGTVRTNKATKL